MVALVARELVDRFVGPRQRQMDRPRRRPDGRVGQGDFVADRLRRDAGEPLRQPKVPVGAEHAPLRREVRGLDHQGLAFPPAAGVAVPLPDPAGQRRPAVERDDAGVVDRLHDERDVSGRLEDLVVGVDPCARRAAQPGQAARQAAHPGGEVLRTGRPRLGRRSRRATRPGRRRQRRNPTVGRIDDQRGAVVELPPEHRERVAGRTGIDVPVDAGQGGEEQVVAGGEVAASVGEEAVGPALQLGDLVVGQPRPAGERRRPLQRRRAPADPDPLQVGPAGGGPRRRPVPRGGRPPLPRRRKRRQRQRRRKQRRGGRWRAHEAFQSGRRDGNPARS